MLPLCLVVSLVCGCSSGSNGARQNPEPADTGTPHQPATAKITIRAGEGGYVIDDDHNAYCDNAREFCDLAPDTGSITLLTAVPRYGYAFNRWSHAEPAQENGPTLALVADTDTMINASFLKQNSISPTTCSAAPGTRFRTLHLGDSLTAPQCWKANCNPYVIEGLQQAERESIRFYETAMAGNADTPRTVAVGGNRINGTNISLSSRGALPAGFAADNFWQRVLNRHGESPDDFDAVVVALGTNDIADMHYYNVSMETIIEQRIRPLLDWLGERPVLWMLPHYSLLSVADSDVRLYARADGIGCSCGDAPQATDCDLQQVLQQCNVDEEQSRETINVFRAVNAFRRHLLELQAEYPNLQAIDAEQLVAEQSQGSYDLYQQLGDGLHFTPQGVEWYAWAHAHIGQSANPACSHGIAPWTMSAAEQAMITRLEPAP